MLKIKSFPGYIFVNWSLPISVVSMFMVSKGVQTRTVVSTEGTIKTSS